ncbi:TPA: hypothetical protein ACSTJY_002541 [Serratia fonticola]|jgi:hypothetical protein|uniref:Uncharacterized protein n=1 Tax=Serratia fonticola TaxID=47917 RepID=A0A448TBP4_SERFO|nr:hypothetical protein [Serratia fonticola]CAI1056656.1 Uncharacterised protein [Serratia fonticola]CAI1165844.1 Uncharacterised protein [Serratia fonticola]CAI1887251.1 Uncharacterised protein [Serratia fonticola]CAI1983201.1 Uncharacterised protein [Serratia fonticola]CAI2494961.1 Uncharacterised protein [Serratia fonticola]
MRLIGSRTESLIRERLEKYENIIIENNVIHDLLVRNFSEIDSVYCLSQVIEQAEDIYTLLVNGEFVIEFELSRIDDSISDVNIKPLNEYSKKVKDKSSKLTLSIAIDLATNR